MPNGVPLFFEGATPSRFYFIGGDHWIVEPGDGDVVALLRQKRYAWWQFALSYLAIPGTIIALTATIAFAASMPEAFWAGIACGVAAGLPMIYIHWNEWKQLNRKPVEIFVLRSDNCLHINGDAYHASNISDLKLEYTFYQPSGAQGDAGCSELDVVFLDGTRERRINLLSQTSNWAWKHARKLQQLTDIELKRTSVAR
jgi:hypothetical protein